MGNLTSAAVRQKHLKQYTDGQLLAFVDVNGATRVMAHLPESISFGVASRYTEPFASLSRDSTAHALFTEFSGRSINTTYITKKIFTGAEQPDITLELKFEAFYDAFEEVVKPVQELMRMAVGQVETTSEAALEAAEGYRDYTLVDNAASSIEENVADVGYQPTFLKAPQHYTIRIGRFARLPKVFISSVNANFSNVMDYNNNPLSATVSVGLMPERPYTKSEILYMFRESNEFRGEVSEL